MPDKEIKPRNQKEPSRSSMTTRFFARFRSNSAQKEPKKHVVIQHPHYEDNGVLALPSDGAKEVCRGYYNSITASTSKNQQRMNGDGDLDKVLMQTCTDVKYVNKRPKFSAVVDANFQIYGSPPLAWSRELADLAKSWATNLAARGRILYPEHGDEVGENIHLITSNDKRVLDESQGPLTVGSGETCTGDHLITGIELIALWAAEAVYFDFGNPKWSTSNQSIFLLNAAEFFQNARILCRYWNTTRDCLAIVALYRPGGNSNFPREIAENIPSKDLVPYNHLEAISLNSLVKALNRTDLGDGGFRKSPLPPSSTHAPNQTKILK